jgi:hypothetical protein
VRLRFDLDFVVFIGAAVAPCAGPTLVASTVEGSTTAGVLLSSIVGLGEAMTCCCCCCAPGFCCVVLFVAAAAGSVSPPALTQPW